MFMQSNTVAFYAPLKSESHADLKAYTTFETDSCYTAFIFNSLLVPHSFCVFWEDSSNTILSGGTEEYHF